MQFRFWLGLAVAAAVATPAAAQDPAKQRLENSPRHHEWVDVPSANGRKVHSFVAYPEVEQAATAVVVIHENRGLTDWVRSVADQLAEQGFVAIAPDLLSGTGPGGGGTEAFGSQDAATKGIYALSPDQVTADLDAVVKYVKDLDATNDKIAVAGFCWGGGQAFRYAARNPEIAASFVFYGTAPAEQELRGLKVPVYGFYGGNDRRITGQVPQVEQTLKSAGKAYEPVTYEDAGHGFMRAGEEAGADPANKKAMQQAWERWIVTLKKL